MNDERDGMGRRAAQAQGATGAKKEAAADTPRARGKEEEPVMCVYVCVDVDVC